ncbi:5927_t:CDS:2, partial [Gigaspora rosea]
KVKILTDSEETIRGIEEGLSYLVDKQILKSKSSFLITSIKDLIIRKKINLQLVKVQVHKGDKWNELANRLVKKENNLSSNLENYENLERFDSYESPENLEEFENPENFEAIKDSEDFENPEDIDDSVDPENPRDSENLGDSENPEMQNNNNLASYVKVRV